MGKGEGEGRLALLGFCGGSLGSCVYGGILVLLVLSLIFTGLGLRRCAFRWTRFLEDTSFVTLGEFLGSLKKVLLCFVGGGEIPGK